jgi:iron complex transport system substrate-binding protein
MASSSPVLTRRRPCAAFTALVVAVAAIAAVVASPPAGAAAEGPFPVSIRHKYGTTTIAERPERVVTLGLSDHEPFLALGVVPVGVDDWFGERPFGQWPWAAELWKGQEPTIVGERDTFNMERIAELEPDVIVGLYSGMSKEQYETLSKLAPTVAQPRRYDDYAAPWEVMTRVVGKVAGKSARAEKLIDAIEGRYAQIRNQHPEFAEQVVAVVDPYEAGQYAAFAPYDQKMLLLQELGFRDSDAIAEAAGDDYAAEISSERLDMVDVDRLLFLTGDPTAQARVEADPVYANLAVAREGRALFVPYGEPPVGAALSFNTVLSIPYALDELVPLLAGSP